MLIAKTKGKNLFDLAIGIKGNLLTSVVVNGKFFMSVLDCFPFIVIFVLVMPYLNCFNLWIFSCVTFYLTVQYFFHIHVVSVFTRLINILKPLSFTWTSFLELFNIFNAS